MTYDGIDTAARVAIERRMQAKAAQTLLGICSGITADGHLHDREILFLSTWLTEHADACRHWPGSVIAQRVREVLADGTVTDDERQDLMTTLESIAGAEFSSTGSAAPAGPALPLDDDPSIFFKNMAFCFTGRFMYGSRPACERAVLKLGGIAVDSVTKKLDYLVIGALIEPQWSNTTYGRKIEKAVEYRSAGSEICIVSELQWTAALADTGGAPR